jgi:hypothetical protein
MGHFEGATRVRLKTASVRWRLACLRVGFIDGPALLDLPDIAHVDEALGIGAFGARVKRKSPQ